MNSHVIAEQSVTSVKGRCRRYARKWCKPKSAARISRSVGERCDSAVAAIADGYVAALSYLREYFTRSTLAGIRVEGEW